MATENIQLLNLLADLRRALAEVRIPDEVEKIYLFGSWARGNFRADSDIDLLAILRLGVKALVNESEGFERLLDLLNRPIPLPCLETTATVLVRLLHKKVDIVCYGAADYQKGLAQQSEFILCIEEVKIFVWSRITSGAG